MSGVYEMDTLMQAPPPSPLQKNMEKLLLSSRTRDLVTQWDNSYHCTSLLSLKPLDSRASPQMP